MLIDRLIAHPCKRLFLVGQRLCCRARYMRNAEAEAEAEAERREAAYEVDSHTSRVNLDRALPTVWSILRQLFKRLTIVEPTLQEVVVFYTEISGATRDDGYDGGYTSAPGTPVTRLKSFRDIPHADVEVVLPGLRVERMKSADVAKIGVILVAGIATALYGFIFSSYSQSRWTLITLISLLVLRGYQTWASVSNSKHTMLEFIRTTLYHRSQV